MDERQFLEKLDRIRDIPTLPSIVLELNKLLQDPDTSVTRISQIIEKDQAIALKILKLVNSAFYGFKSKISDIHNAVIMLGFNAVRNAIVSVSVIEAFAKKLRLEGFDITDFWKHSLAVAVTSKSLSVQHAHQLAGQLLRGRASCTTSARSSWPSISRRRLPRSGPPAARRGSRSRPRSKR